MDVGLMAGAGVFVFMVGVATLGITALQAIGFAMFSGLKAPQRPSFKTLMGVRVIEFLGAGADGGGRQIETFERIPLPVPPSARPRPHVRTTTAGVPVFVERQRRE